MRLRLSYAGFGRFSLWQIIIAAVLSTTMLAVAAVHLLFPITTGAPAASTASKLIFFPAAASKAPFARATIPAAAEAAADTLHAAAKTKVLDF